MPSYNVHCVHRSRLRADWHTECTCGKTFRQDLGQQGVLGSNLLNQHRGQMWSHRNRNIIPPIHEENVSYIIPSSLGRKSILNPFPDHPHLSCVMPLCDPAPCPVIPLKPKMYAVLTVHVCSRHHGTRPLWPNSKTVQSRLSRYHVLLLYHTVKYVHSP